MRTYKQLTYEQRCQIGVLNGTDMTQQEIADAVGTSQATVSRELRRKTEASVVIATSGLRNWPMSGAIVRQKQ